MGLELVLELVAQRAKPQTEKIQLFCLFKFFKNDVKKPSARLKNLAEGLLLCYLEDMNSPLAKYDIITEKLTRCAYY